MSEKKIHGQAPTMNPNMALLWVDRMKIRVAQPCSGEGLAPKKGHSNAEKVQFKGSIMNHAPPFVIHIIRAYLIAKSWPITQTHGSIHFSFLALDVDAKAPISNPRCNGHV
jgi:hypothetical protein